MNGGIGNDALYRGDGRDVLFASTGVDRLYGQRGTTSCPHGTAAAT